ncbi:MAG: signal peptidase I [Lachnospiraceae bacterium]|nr:signal peptidase I [Clostridiales bacterium]MDY3109489.1 signal peptidase I [Lachnospiraceae bacterium]
MAKKKGLVFYEKEKKINKKVIHEILEYVISTVIVVFLAFVLMFFFGTKTSVIGDSMMPALYNGQQILIDKFIYKLSSPKRGDVIVFQPNGNENTHYYEKRIIGLPGETIQIIDGYVYVNGSKLDEDDTYDLIEDPGIAKDELILQPYEYFVLGDNRNSSEDSRSGNMGPVKKEYIIGKAWLHMAYGDAGIGMIK